MGMKERMEAWFPGSTGESEGEKAMRLGKETLKLREETLRLTRKLQTLRGDRANVTMFMMGEGSDRGDMERVQSLDQQIAETVDQLKALGIDVPPESGDHR
jgi:hypothetical protein